ncbi:polyprenyl synthetase family protein [Rufibacter glacialis]|uniref:Polyprenyl synthetase family protein n=1 Tax=Rufibacter glacialis TaxID=1259555 RepID=A0A5M8QC45_9BACT|nr:polyprenyl synthetase family protein [Rufibacter glacialis]KAA6433549.1 polyprenyl synthetase family protein [Rufibacter glacialis]GGK73154.1 isoprenyl synthetase [Rufibacter glacialis]
MDISQFSERINQTLSTLHYGQTPEELYAPIRYMMELGGKRVRPLLTVLGAYLFHDEVEKAIMPAIGVEVFHNFTLMHDDIMDNAPLRRGNATVHEKWNTNTAILSGDVMLVRAYEFFLGIEPKKLPTALKLFSTCAAQVCEGQQLDMNFETRQDVQIEEYLHMIRLKTAVLLGFSLELGALINNAAAEDARHLKEFGINMGIAFQLRDDLLDVYGDQAKFGKRVGGDILSDKKTYLLLTALERSSATQRKELVKWQSKTKPETEQQKVEAVKEIYDGLNIQSITQNQINHYFQKGLHHLNEVNALNSKKELLRLLAIQLIERDS